MIVQGTNQPIVISFKGFIPVYKQFEASLIDTSNNIVFHWNKDDITVERDCIILPMSQEDTSSLSAGAVKFEARFLDLNDVIRPVCVSKIPVAGRTDKTPIGDGTAKIDYCAHVIEMDVESGQLVYKGFSPYIGENGNWYEFDNKTEKFVDTGVHAQGDPYDHSEEFSRLAAQVRNDAVLSEGYKASAKKSEENALKYSQNAKQSSDDAETSALNAGVDAGRSENAMNVAIQKADESSQSATESKNASTYAETQANSAKSSANSASASLTAIDKTIKKGLEDYDANATEKTNAYNTNATNKTTVFNTNATTKQNAFDQNATSKTTAFNQNATQKTADFDEHAGEMQKDISRLSESIAEISKELESLGLYRDEDGYLCETEDN